MGETKRKVKRLKKDEALLMVIDFQERLMPAMYEKEALEDKVVRLIRGARVMELPILVSQQYTRGLGPTIPSVSEALGEFTPRDKTTFSIMQDEQLAQDLKATKRKTVILAGIESHICVEQSALDLLEEGYQVFICGDCVSSRKPGDIRMAQSRMEEAGAVYTSMEAALFELCGGAKQPGFKEISAIIK